MEKANKQIAQTTQSARQVDDMQKVLIAVLDLVSSERERSIAIAKENEIRMQQEKLAAKANMSQVLVESQLEGM